MHWSWVHRWQPVGSVHPPGDLVGLQGSGNSVFFFVKKHLKMFSVLRVKWPTAFWCKTAHAWLFMYAETCQRCAIAEQQWGPGQQPSSTAAWQAVVALGWPLSPPSCPHSLTSLAWQQQPNKLRAPQSSHRSMGMFFTVPTPPPHSLWSLWSLCCTQTHPHVKWNLIVVYIGIWRNIHKLACSLHQLGFLLIHVDDEYSGSRFGGGVGQKCFKIVTLFCCMCGRTVHAAITITILKKI